MKKINIRLIFPYNWAHARKVGVYDDKGQRVTKIGHFEEIHAEVNTDTRYLLIKLDFYRFKVEVPKDVEELNFIIYMKFRDSFPAMYWDSLKRNLIQGQFVDAETYKLFDNTFYKKSGKWMQKSEVDTPAVILGMLISSGLVVMSVVQQENPYQHLVFFIGVASLISLLMIRLEKDKLMLFDYKSRMWASGAAFILGSSLLQGSFPVTTLFILFSLLFLLKTYKCLNTHAY